MLRTNPEAPNQYNKSSTEKQQRRRSQQHTMVKLSETEDEEQLVSGLKSPTPSADVSACQERGGPSPGREQ